MSNKTEAAAKNRRCSANPLGQKNRVYAATIPSIHLVMTTNIKQYNLLLSHQQRKRNTITIGKADSVASGQFPGQRVQPQGGLKRVLLQFGDYFGKAGLGIGMLLEKLAGLMEELLRGGDGVHVSRFLPNQVL